MPSTITIPLKQSASKEEFVRTLGLSPTDPQDKWKLEQMWGEVTEWWMKNVEISTRAILKPEYAVNSTVTQPYKWGHLKPSFVDEAITDIWAHAKPWPRHFFDQGHSDDRRVFNWVLKWLLWHVCRYRDWRNLKGKVPKKNGTTEEAAGHSTLPPHDYWTTVMN